MFGLKKKQYEVPLAVRTRFHQHLEEGKYTPDIAQLGRYEIQLVFLADDLQRGHPRHELIKEHSAFLCNAETISPFTMFKKNLGGESYPVAMRASQFTTQAWRNPKPGTDTGAVRGQIHAVRPQKFFPLVDKLKGNTIQSFRERIDFMVKYRVKSYSRREGWHMSELKQVFVQAWMYLGYPEWWDNMPMTEIKAVRMYVPNNGFDAPYYKFTHMEYNDD